MHHSNKKSIKNNKSMMISMESIKNYIEIKKKITTMSLPSKGLYFLIFSGTEYVFLPNNP